MPDSRGSKATSAPKHVYPAPPFRIPIVVGSSRPGSLSLHSARIIVDALGSAGDHASIIDPATMNLSFSDLNDMSSTAIGLREQIRPAQGIILVTPEHHGSFSAVLKAIIELLGYPSELSDKPIALVGLAAGKMAALKAIEHLRSVCAHVGGIVLPWSIALAEAHSLFDENGVCRTPGVEAQLRGVALGMHEFLLRGHPRVP